MWHLASNESLRKHVAPCGHRSAINSILRVSDVCQRYPRDRASAIETDVDDVLCGVYIYNVFVWVLEYILYTFLLSLLHDVVYFKTSRSGGVFMASKCMESF